MQVSLEDLVPGHTIVREGIVTEGMFMISRGKLHIFVNSVMVAWRLPGEYVADGFRLPPKRLHETDCLLCQRRDGRVLSFRYVGEHSLLQNTPAKASCVTANWCTLMVLRRKDFSALCLQVIAAIMAADADRLHRVFC